MAYKILEELGSADPVELKGYKVLGEVTELAPGEIPGTAEGEPELSPLPRSEQIRQALRSKLTPIIGPDREAPLLGRDEQAQAEKINGVYRPLDDSFGRTGIAPTLLSVPGRLGKFAGDVTAGGVADVGAAASDYFNPPTEGDSFGGNLKAAASGEELPVRRAIKLAREDEKSRDEFGGASLLAEGALGAAETIPKIGAAMALGGSTLAGQGAANATLFGIDDKGEIQPVQAAFAALIPGVSKVAGQAAQKAIVAGMRSGITSLDNALAQKTIEFFTEQAAVNAWLTLQNTPEYVTLAKEDPDEFARVFARDTGMNLAFSLMGIRKFGKDIPSETQNWFNEHGQIMADRFLTNPQYAAKVTKDYTDVIRGTAAEIENRQPAPRVIPEDTHVSLGPRTPLIGNRLRQTRPLWERMDEALGKGGENNGQEEAQQKEDVLSASTAPEPSVVEPAAAPSNTKDWFKRAVQIRNEAHANGVYVSVNDAVSQAKREAGIAEEVKQPKGIELADAVAAATPESFVTMTQSGPLKGGFTNHAIEIGKGLKTPEELQRLKDHEAAAQAELDGAIKAEDAEQINILGSRKQFFTEAIGAATGEGAAGEFLTKSDPNYKPPFPAKPTVEPAPVKAEPVPRLLDEVRGVGRDVGPWFHDLTSLPDSNADAASWLTQSMLGWSAEGKGVGSANNDKNVSRRALILKDNETGQLVEVGIYDNRGVKIVDPATGKGKDALKLLRQYSKKEGVLLRYEPVASIRYAEGQKNLRRPFSAEDFAAAKDYATEKQREQVAALGDANAAPESVLQHNADESVEHEAVSIPDVDLSLAKDFEEYMNSKVLDTKTGKLRNKLSEQDYLEFMGDMDPDLQLFLVRQFASSLMEANPKLVTELASLDPVAMRKAGFTPEHMMVTIAKSLKRFYESTQNITSVGDFAYGLAKAIGPIPEPAKAQGVERGDSAAGSRPSIAETLGKIEAKLGAISDELTSQKNLNSFFAGMSRTVAAGAIDIVRLGLRAGKSLAMAIADGIAWVKLNHPTEAIDEAQFRTLLTAGQMDADAIQIAKLGKDKVGAMQRASRELEGVSYYSDQFATAKHELETLTNQARVRVIDGDLPDTAIPDPNRLNFTDKLDALGISYDKEIVQSLQKAIKVEKSAARLAQKREELDSLILTRKSLEGFGVHKDVIEEVDKDIKTLQRSVSQRSRIAEVRARADEIAVNEKADLQRQAMKKALTNPQVRDAFVKKLSLLDQLEEAGAEVRNINQIEPEQRPTVLAKVAEVFRVFDFQKATLDATAAARRTVLLREIRDLTNARRDERMASGYAEILLSDAMKTLTGEVGLTGALNPAELAELRSSIAAVEHFSKVLARYGENATAQAVRDFIVDPEHFPLPDLIPEDLGVNKATFQLIAKALEASPEFGSAVLSLVDIAKTDKAKLTDEKLKALADKVAAGSTEEAEALFDHLQTVTMHALSKADAAARTADRMIQRKLIELESLRHAQELFDSVVKSDAFKTLRHTAETEAGLTVQMIEANVDRTSFKKFTIPGEEKGQDELQAAADTPNSPMFSERSLPEIFRWFERAREYVDGYNTAKDNFASGASTVSPVSMGYDPAIARGLEAALKHDATTFMDVSLSFNETVLKKSKLLVKLQGSQLFRQLLQSSRLVDSVFGSQFKSKLARWVNVTHDVSGINSRPVFRELPKLRNAALKSHPELGHNVESYRTLVLNEMGHMGRTFGTALKVGVRLPISGMIVTAQDMAFFQRMRNYSDALRAIEESRIDRGIRTTIGTTEFRRKAVSVGDEGVPRTISNDGFVAARDIADAYTKAKPWDDTTNLSDASTDVTVQIWNRLEGEHNALASHILDSTRSDRSMSIDPHMMKAERALASDIARYGKDSLKLETVEDYVNALVDRFPTGTGLSERSFIIKQLSKELGQYGRNAKLIVDDRARDQTLVEHVQAFNSNTEFTKEAAKLMLPGSLYDYGAVADWQFRSASARAMAEPAVEMTVALRQVEKELGQRIDAFKSDPVKNAKVLDEWNGDVELAETMRRALISLTNETLTKHTSPGTFGKLLGGPSSVIIGAWLTSPTAAFNNINGSGLATFVLLSKIHAFSRLTSMLITLKNVTAITTRAMADVTANLTGAKAAVRFIEAKHPALYKATLEWAANTYKKYVTDHLDEVNSIGMAEDRKSFRQAVADAYHSMLEQAAAQEGSKVSRGGALAAKVVGEGLRKIGLSYYELLINGQNVMLSKYIEGNLKAAALKYGAEREALGEYNPSDARWAIKPEEYSSRLFSADRATNVAHLRSFLSTSAGLRLEPLLWDYYKRQKAAPDAPLLSPEQDISLKRGLVAETNRATQANRASALKSNSGLRFISMLQGYNGFFFQALTESFRTARSTGDRDTILLNTLTMASIALAAAGLGMISLTEKEKYNKLARNKLAGYAVPLSSSFWKHDMASNVAMAAMSGIPYIGSGILALLAEARGNKGFDPGNAIPGISQLTDVVNLGRGLWAMRSDPSNWTFPLRTWAERNVPFFNELERITGTDTRKDWTNGVTAYSASAKAAGVDIDRKPFYGAAIPGASGAIKDSLMRALISGDSEGAASAHDKLVAYHEKANLAHGMDAETAKKEAEKSAKRDYDGLNPAAVASGGKKPTEAEYNQVLSSMTDEQRAAFDRTMAAWKGGASLFGSNAQPTEGTSSSGGSGGFSTGGGGGGFGGSGSSGGKVSGSFSRGLGGSGISGGASYGGGFSRLRIGSGSKAGTGTASTSSAISRLRKPRLPRAKAPRVAKVAGVKKVAGAKVSYKPSRLRPSKLRRKKY